MTSSMLAFEIDPFNKEASLTENFSTNCLQMTQSQQMLKAYVMVGLNSTFQNPKGHLKKAIVDYDKRVYQVREYFQKLLKPTETKGKQAFDEALKLWQENKLLLEKTPNKQNALIIKDNFQLMITKLLEGTAPLATPELELISLTGKLCRKPIEITIDYLLKIWGITIPNYTQTIQGIITNYHKNLKTLTANKHNNEKSLGLLKKAKKQFMFFEMMYNAKSIFIPSLLSKKADNNFLIIREIKKIYKKEATK
jgi:hypothetical protein